MGAQFEVASDNVEGGNSGLSGGVTSAVGGTGDKINFITDTATFQEMNQALLDNDMLNEEFRKINNQKYVCYDRGERKSSVNDLNNVSHSHFPIDGAILIVQIVDGKAISVK